jgi:hypothetical protein
MIKLDREETSFVTPEGILSFPALHPGEAQDVEVSPGSKSYKCELIVPTITVNDQITKAVALVAQTNDKVNWQKYVFGTQGRLRKLEEMPGRDHSLYPYAVGKFVLGFSKIISLKFLKMEGTALTDPAQRVKYDAAVAAHAPKVKKFANPNNPADMAKIEAIVQEKSLRGLTVPKENEYFKMLIDVEPHEMWAGCIVKVHGRAYWNDNKKTGGRVLLGLESVLFVREGDRLVGESNPDEVFAPFAPSEELAPSPFAQQTAKADPWGALV